MLQKFFLLLAVFLTGSGFSAVLPLSSIPPMERPPVMDGKIDMEEWKGSTSFYGLGEPLDAREGYAWFGYDRENLYFAFKTEMPPEGRLVTNVKRMGGEVVGDDSIEIWIVPPGEGRDIDGPRSKGYFQLIINSAGTVFSMHHEPGYGLSAATWGPNISWGSKTDKDFWYMELSIPLKDLGMKNLIFPSEWRMRLVRNWKNPWRQAAIPQAASFTDTKNMAEIVFDDRSPAVRLESVGHLMAGKTDLRVCIFNPMVDGTGVDLKITVASGEKITFSEVKGIELQGRSEEKLTLPISFQLSDNNRLSIEIKEKGGEKRFYHREIVFGRFF